MFSIYLFVMLYQSTCLIIIIYVFKLKMEDIYLNSLKIYIWIHEKYIFYFYDSMTLKSLKIFEFRMDIYPWKLTNYNFWFYTQMDFLYPSTCI